MRKTPEQQVWCGVEAGWGGAREEEHRQEGQVSWCRGSCWALGRQGGRRLSESRWWVEAAHRLTEAPGPATCGPHTERMGTSKHGLDLEDTVPRKQLVTKDHGPAKEPSYPEQSDSQTRKVEGRPLGAGKGPGRYCAGDRVSV